jgi:hypothetical protein
VLETEFLFLPDWARPRGVDLSVRLVDMVDNAWCVLNPLAKCLAISWNCLKVATRMGACCVGLYRLNHLCVCVCVCVYISTLTRFAVFVKEVAISLVYLAHAALCSDPGL